MTSLSQKIIRYTLAALLLLIAINAFGGGYFAMSGAEGIPVEWLQRSLFTNYYYPGLFLFAGIGGLSLFSAIAVFGKRRIAGKIVFVSGITILIWLVVQVAIVGYVSWMQPATAGIAIVILILNRLLSKNENHEYIPQ